MRVTSSLIAMLLGWLVSIIQQAPAFLLPVFLIMIGYQKPSAPKSSSNSNGPPRVRVESRDFQMLSGLRGLAALVVLFRHINVGSYIGGYGGLAELGVFMVATFFVLSAFLLSFRALRDDIPLWGHPQAQLGLRNWLFSNHPQPAVSALTRASNIGMEALRPSQYWTKYLLRRFFRVWPLFAFIVICCHIWPGEVSSRLYGAFGGPILDSFLMRDRLLGREMAQFWSLRPEFSYYLLIPFYIITWKTAEQFDGVNLISATGALPDSERPSIFTQRYTWSSKTWRIAHFAISLFICLYQATFNPLRNASHQHQYVGAYLPVFWAGTAGAVILHVLLQNGWTVNPHKLASQKSPQGWFSCAILGDTIGFLIVAGVIASDDWYYTMITGHAQVDHWWSWGPRRHEDGSEIGPVMMCWAGVIVSSYILSMTVLAPRGINAALLSSPLLVRAGDISFSIYSVHPFVDSWMRAHLIPESLKGLDCLIVILVGIWVAAEITYRCVEMPFMRLGNALCGKVDGVARRIESTFEMGYHQMGVGEEDIDIDDLEADKRLSERLGHTTYNF